jgi:hypothetical protein
VVDTRPRTLTEAQQRFLLSLAQKAVALLERRRSKHEFDQRRRQESTSPPYRRAALNSRRSLELFDAISKIALEMVDPEVMLTAALDILCKATGWNIGHAWLPDGQEVGAKLSSLQIWRTDGGEGAENYRRAIDGEFGRCSCGLLGRAMDGRAAVTLSNFRSVQRFGIDAGIAAPLLGRELHGAIEVLSTGGHWPGPQFESLLGRIGGVLGRALERQRSRLDIRRSEAYYRRLAEESLDLVTILDAKGDIRFESRSHGVELGWDPEELVGRSAFQFVHPDDLQAVIGAFTESLRTEGPTPLISFRFRHKDGSYRVLEGRGNNLLSDPAIAGIVFASRDITERIRLQEQFGQLAGGIAHDFNNLLTVIVGYSSRAEAHPDAEPALKAALVEIRRAAQRAAGLTGQLLAFTGRQVLQPRFFRFDSLLEESEKGLRLLLGGKIRLEIEPHAGDSCVFADLAQLGMVLLHLSNNAREAMPGGGEVHIDSSVIRLTGVLDARALHLTPGEYALLTIRDTGCGMPPETRAHIFEPYFSTKPRGKGTGLSLAACQGIIHQSGGEIAVTSEPGVGTEFSIYLPLVQSSDCAGGQQQTSRRKRSGGQTILFAEDEEVLRELGTSVLEDLGYRVFSAENGRAALALLDQHPEITPDLLLTDIMMPEMDGRGLAEAIRKRYPQVPILFCSGYAQDQSFYHGLPAGSSFLAKPYTFSALAEMLDKLLQPA